MRPRHAAALLSCFAALTSCQSAPAPASPIAWREWSPTVFADARAAHKLVLLDLGTTWCHWCHVMEGTTYADTDVRTILATHFIAVEEDADRRLDLAARYQDYGWPATIVFDADGRELWKNRGYVEPQRMLRVLQLLVADPAPLAAEPEATTSGATANALAADVRSELTSRMDVLYDDAQGGFRGVHKFLDGAAAEWLLARARTGDATARQRLLQTLDAERGLLDPAWGGAYQYSHGGVWSNPHYEKIMSRQLADLRSYALAYGAFGRAADLDAARLVARFLREILLSPDGAFFASQDADLVRGEHSAEYFSLDGPARRALGLPHIEKGLWSRENGQAIQALCALLAVHEDAELLATTTRAAQWIVANRRLPDGAFRHADVDVGGPYLADSVEMAAALVALAEVRTEPRWLLLAVETMAAIDHHFSPRAPGAGYATAVGDGVLPPVVDRTENVLLGRIANRVFQQSGDATARSIAERAFAFVAQEGVALQRGLPADLLLFADEIGHDPVHVVVVGGRDDEQAQELFAAALRTAPAYRVVEWIGPGEATARGDRFPDAPTAAAFVCRDGACSAPIFDADDLARRLLPVR